MSTSIKLAALFAASMVAAGCNTMRGFGEDLQSAGGAIAGAGNKKDEKKAPNAPAPAATPAPAPAAGPAPAPQAPTQPVRR